MLPTSVEPTDARDCAATDALDCAATVVSSSESVAESYSRMAARRMLKMKRDVVTVDAHHMKLRAKCQNAEISVRGQKRKRDIGGWWRYSQDADEFEGDGGDEGEDEVRHAKGCVTRLVLRQWKKAGAYRSRRGSRRIRPGIVP